MILLERDVHRFTGDFEPAEYSPELAQIISEVLQSPESRLGKGKSADIRRSLHNPRIAYKIIVDREFYTNSVRKEANLADELRAISGEVRVPAIYFSYMAEDIDGSTGGLKENIHAIGMEAVNGASIEDILLSKAFLPEGFDVKKFTAKLKRFLDLMHSKKIYHRDLHAGNIMVGFDPENTPYVIDFGDAVHYPFDGDPYRTDPDVIGNVTVYQDDNSALQESLSKLRIFMANK